MILAHWCELVLEYVNSELGLYGYYKLFGYK